MDALFGKLHKGDDMINSGKMDALKKMKAYIDGMEPASKEGETEEDALKKGIAEEMSEHEMSEEEATKVAMDHLAEDPEYYSKGEEASEMGGEEDGSDGQMGTELDDMADTDGEGFLKKEESEEEGKPAISISVLARNKPKGGFQKGRK